MQRKMTPREFFTFYLKFSCSNKIVLSSCSSCLGLVRAHFAVKKSQINGFSIKIWLKKCYLHQKCINSCNSFWHRKLSPLRHQPARTSKVWVQFYLSAKKLEVKRETLMRCHFFWNHSYIVIVTTTA